MKSKITLIILLVIIFFFAALSFYFGYNYFNEKSTVNAQNEQIEVLKSYQKGTEETTESQVQVVEKNSIAKIDDSKIDKSKRDYIKTIVELPFLEGYEEPFRWVKGPITSYSTVSTDVYTYDYQVEYNNKKYMVSDTAGIEQLEYYTVGGTTVQYAVVLLSDGTLKYTKVDMQNKADLEFKDYELKDVVKLVQCFATTEQRVTNCLCAITSDGVTHILPYPLGE